MIGTSLQIGNQIGENNSTKWITHRVHNTLNVIINEIFLMIIYMLLQNFNLIQLAVIIFFKNIQRQINGIQRILRHIQKFFSGCL